MMSSLGLIHWSHCSTPFPQAHVWCRFFPGCFCGRHPQTVFIRETGQITCQWLEPKTVGLSRQKKTDCYSRYLTKPQKSALPAIINTDWLCMVVADTLKTWIKHPLVCRVLKDPLTQWNRFCATIIIRKLILHWEVGGRRTDGWESLSRVHTI